MAAKIKSTSVLFDGIRKEDGASPDLAAVQAATDAFRGRVLAMAAALDEAAGPCVRGDVVVDDEAAGAVHAALRALWNEADAARRVLGAPSDFGYRRGDRRALLPLAACVRSLDLGAQLETASDVRIRTNAVNRGWRGWWDVRLRQTLQGDARDLEQSVYGMCWNADKLVLDVTRFGNHPSHSLSCGPADDGTWRLDVVEPCVHAHYEYVDVSGGRHLCILPGQASLTVMNTATPAGTPCREGVDADGRWHLVLVERDRHHVSEYVDASGVRHVCVVPCGGDGKPSC